MEKRAGKFVAGSAMLLALAALSGAPSTVAVSQPAPAAAYVGSSIDRWNALRASTNAPFETYSSFLLAHRDWPAEQAMRRAAERQIVVGVTGVGDVMRYFAALPPLTPVGHANYALALEASGRQQDALREARAGWTGGTLPEQTEARILSIFGSRLTTAEHDQRIDALLSGGDAAGARRIMAYASPARRPIFEARLAVQARTPDAPALVSALGAAGDRDAGLLMDRALIMNRNGNPGGARQLMAQRRSLSAPPANPERFMEVMFVLARGAANDGNMTQAYAIASQVDDIYPAGTDVSQKPFGERDEYTNLTWLAGTTALRNLGRPADAMAMFERYGRASQSPQSRTKGLYWAGHAARVAGQTERMQQYLGEAARNYDQFYGQLAADRLRQPLPVPPTTGDEPTAADRQWFNASSLAAAVRHLGQRNDWTRQTLFIRALGESARTDGQRRLVAELGRSIGRPDLGVWTSREARRTDSTHVYRWGFPELNVPPAQASLWPLVHGITRQESLFDRRAVSSAGARGLMQLMPATARQVSGRMGLPYTLDRLTSDPDYNVMLGSTFFESLLSQWGGSYPLAIASYNAGPGNVRRWVNSNGDPRTPGVDMVEWIERIPFAETRNYVQRVLENAVVYELMHPQRARSPANGRVSYYLGLPRS